MLQSRMLEAAGVSPGWLAIAAVGVAVVSYFLGCFNGAVVVSRYILRDDIREHGSGNAGLTNFYRVFGGPLTAMVILSDALKAVLAVLFAMFIAGHISPALVTLAKYWAGTFCVIGHMYPCTFQFRGGKGVLSGGTLTVMIGIGGGGGMLPGWTIPVVALGGFIVLAAATRYVSLGSCWGGASYIVMSWLVYRDPLILLLAAIPGGLLLWKHRGNLVRIVKGTESKFTLHKKAGADEPPKKAEETAEQKPEKKADQKPEKEAAQQPEKKAVKKPAKKAAKGRKGSAAKKAGEEKASLAESAPEADETPSAGEEQEDRT